MTDLISVFVKDEMENEEDINIIVKEETQENWNESTDLNLNKNMKPTMEDTDNAQCDPGPWPYINNYFQFTSRKGGTYFFQCQVCFPAKKIVSCSGKSRNGLKSHYFHMHSLLYEEFKNCLADGSRASRFKKRRYDCDLGSQESQDKVRELSSSSEHNNYLSKNEHTGFAENGTAPTKFGEPSSFNELQKRSINLLNRNTNDNIQSDVEDAFKTSYVPLNQVNWADFESEDLLQSDSCLEYNYAPRILETSEISDRNVSLNFQNDSLNSDCKISLNKYFLFSTRKDDVHSFICKLCLPLKKVMRCIGRSRTILIKHLQSTHSYFLYDLSFCTESDSKQLRSRLQFPNEEHCSPHCNDFLSNFPEWFQSKTLNYSSSTIEDKIVNLVIENFSLLNAIQTTSFHELFHLIPGYCSSYSSKARIEELIETRYERQREELKATLSKQKFLSATADIFNILGEKTYLGMTVLWLDSDSLKRKQKVLSFHQLSNTPTRDELVTAINDALFSFEITKKVVCITLDNSIPFEDKFTEIQSNPPTTSKEERFRYNYLDFLATHQGVDVGLSDILADEESAAGSNLPKCIMSPVRSLSLVVNEALKNSLMDEKYKQSSESVFVKASSLWQEQSQCSEAAERLLIIPKRGSWRSLYRSVVDIIEASKKNKTELEILCSSSGVFSFTDDEQLFLSDFRDILNPIYAAFEILLSRSENAYFGLLLPCLATIFNRLEILKLTGIHNSCNILFHSITKGLRERFKPLLTDVDCLIATSVNPNFKLSQWLEWLPDFNSTVKRTYIIDRVTELIQGPLVENAAEWNENCITERTFFDVLYDTPDSPKDSSRVKHFLELSPTRNPFDRQIFPSNAFRDVFIRYNTPCLSAVIRENFFSVNEMRFMADCITDEKHLEMLIFLRWNRSKFEKN